jgi:hypothetical protein
MFPNAYMCYDGEQEVVSNRLMRSFSIDGVIDKQSTIKMVTQSVDNEVYNLFMNYTTDSMMNEKSFIDMMRDCRILSKQDLRYVMFSFIHQLLVLL